MEQECAALFGYNIGLLIGAAMIASGNYLLGLRDDPLRPFLASAACIGGVGAAVFGAMILL